MEKNLTKSVMGFFGQRFHFKYCGIWYSGIFIGISADLDGAFGMAFMCVRVLERPVDTSVILLIHPSQAKCMARSPFLKLRAKVRSLFKKYGLTKTPENVYVPVHCLSALCQPNLSHEPHPNMS